MMMSAVLQGVPSRRTGAAFAAGAVAALVGRRVQPFLPYVNGWLVALCVVLLGWCVARLRYPRSGPKSGV